MSLVGIELDNGGVLLKFVETAAENGGARHLQEARYPARSPRPPYHCHPKQDERFTILEGQLRFHVDGEDRDVKAGEAIELRRGSFHYAHNLGDVPVLATWETRPAMRTAALFMEMAEAMKGRPRPPLLDALAILGEYRDHIQLAKPPLLVQRVLFACVAPLGWRRQARASR
jgi:mannose-6-phosphate isomerase-like protein (cupin superfamily)